MCITAVTPSDLTPVNAHLSHAILKWGCLHRATLWDPYALHCGVLVGTHPLWALYQCEIGAYLGPALCGLDEAQAGQTTTRG